jgi:hypothetical protein
MRIRWERETVEWMLRPAHSGAATAALGRSITDPELWSAQSDRGRTVNAQGPLTLSARPERIFRAAAASRGGFRDQRSAAAAVTRPR